MMIRPVTFVTIMLTINTLKMVDLVLVMTDGGPRGATRVIGYTVWRENIRQQSRGVWQRGGGYPLYFGDSRHRISNSSSSSLVCHEFRPITHYHQARQRSICAEVILEPNARRPDSSRHGSLLVDIPGADLADAVFRHTDNLFPRAV